MSFFIRCAWCQWPEGLVSTVAGSMPGILCQLILSKSRVKQRPCLDSIICSLLVVHLPVRASFSLRERKASNWKVRISVTLSKPTKNYAISSLPEVRRSWKLISKEIYSKFLAKPGKWVACRSGAIKLEVRNALRAKKSHFKNQPTSKKSHFDKKANDRHRSNLERNRRFPEKRRRRRRQRHRLLMLSLKNKWARIKNLLYTQLNYDQHFWVSFKKLPRKSNLVSFLLPDGNSCDARSFCFICCSSCDLWSDL